MRGVFLVLALVFLVACGSAAGPTEIAEPPATPSADPPQVSMAAPVPSPAAPDSSSSGSSRPASSANSVSSKETPAPPAPREPNPPVGPTVQEVSATGGPGAYTLRVRVASPDTGCDEFADWWEVLSAEGDLLYRRVLLHSHVGEQPFTRSGGPVPALPDQELLVRAHLNTTGYGNQAMGGTIAGGFAPREIAPDFALDVEQLAPQPNGCAF